MSSVTNTIVLNGFKGETVSVGDVIFVGPFRNRGNHGAFVKITKVNKKTLKGVELKQSYSEGTNWSIHKESEYAKVGLGEDGLMKMNWNL